MRARSRRFGRPCELDPGAEHENGWSCSKSPASGISQTVFRLPASGDFAATCPRSQAGLGRAGFAGWPSDGHRQRLADAFAERALQRQTVVRRRAVTSSARGLGQPASNSAAARRACGLRPLVYASANSSDCLPASPVASRGTTTTGGVSLMLPSIAGLRGVVEERRQLRRTLSA